jgi:hypothetical protein
MKTKKDDKTEKGIIGSFLGSMHSSGDFSKELATTETFQNEFKEVDREIEENLRKGEKKRWGFKVNISVRPIIKEVKNDTSKVTIGEDYSYGRKGNKLILAVKAPQEKVILKIKGKNLLLISDNFEKKIELPDYFRDVRKKQYKNGILFLELIE